MDPGLCCVQLHVSWQAAWLNWSATAAVLLYLVASFAPKLSFAECVAMSIPVGFTTSAWIGLLVKSFWTSRWGEMCVWQRDPYASHAAAVTEGTELIAAASRAPLC
jgi:hypothetical protein